ncbi:Gfo/Idh/MocA family oxidoreductase [Brucella sp. BE17]|uniref:Gfo/Idh/MocA family protein n=1 Tax=Brucella sp. BE17 TaxID=3142977 RepID=UPI0031BB4C1D
MDTYLSNGSKVARISLTSRSNLACCEIPMQSLYFYNRRAEATALRETEAKMERNGWAVIGASTIAREYIVNAVRLCGGDIRWIVSSDLGRARYFAIELGIPFATNDLSQALDDCEVDHVYVGSANSSHKAQVIESARAKKNILCEKPIATSLVDAVEMVEACAESGVVLGINHHLRAKSAHEQIKRSLQSGLIGDVRSMTVLNASLLRPSLQTWRIKNVEEGGIYLDLSVHSIDLARYLLEQEPTSASGIGGTLMLGGNGIHDHIMYTIKMSGGAFLQCHESFVSANVTTRLTILGSEGSIVAESMMGQSSGGRLLHQSNRGIAEIPFECNDAYVGTIRSFLNAIAHGTSPLATGEDAIKALIGASAVHRAVSLGETVEVDVIRATFARSSGFGEHAAM